ncbi:RecX family transcriptional regulator [Agromyces atrinae]|uniref:regulatory protein RecX n=1 Tax=Agromyces atrinae TaxID=592376 RepID=UPI001F55FB05|nr:regulatory protein RecX [Agromyces atrinae]MCI2958323.1 RecX family transcriptional regulator [Agromyces atrinae]
MSRDESTGDERLAPVSYLPGASGAVQGPASASDAIAAGPKPGWEFGEDEMPPSPRISRLAASPTAASPAGARVTVARFGAGARDSSDPDIDGSDEDSDDLEDDETETRQAAEDRLLRRLRSKSLSMDEAYRLLTAEGAVGDDADAILSHFQRLGYLDDARLAEEIVRSHHERKGMGRALVEREMFRRGIDSAVIIETIAALPDDDAGAALELAEKRARSMRSLTSDVAERRLVGFLQRKGYNGSVARQAARSALGLR